MNSTGAMVGLLTASAATLGACQGVHWTNLLTLGVTALLFFGTLNLNRRAASPAPRTQSNDTTH